MAQSVAMDFELTFKRIPARPEGRDLLRSTTRCVADRMELAERMFELAPRVGSAWVELWGRLWRIDTLFETAPTRRVWPYPLCSSRGRWGDEAWSLFVVPSSVT